ncbi:branched-chain amino acid ABC transporter permease [Deferrisoma camini]|uniref:branched-chain amino acid ABC transporter permease n=1 Tax=Deferrisoma camini TaxID=1035120 RepID=UPI00046C91B6|nr:branched-chain amino acid ABC transporter permease [Deferrisoma camini]
MNAQPQRRKERIDRGIKARAETIYALSSLEELAYLLGPRLLFIVGFLALPLILAPWPYWHRVALSVCVLGLVSVSFDFLANQVGLVSLGGAFFFGVGGYTAALLNTAWGLPPVLAIGLATVVGAGICAVLISPCLPLRGIYFAIVTLMYPLLMTRIIEAADILGGTEGFRGIAGFSSVWTEAYGLILGLLVGVFGLRRYLAEDAGLVIRAVKENDQSVRASGISVAGVRFKALYLAGLLGCFAGAYYVHMYRSVGISAFALDLSILPIAATVIGGGGTLVGPVIGSLILVPLSEVLRDFGSLRIVVYSLVLAGFVVFRSEGILVFAARKYQQFERWVEV